MDDRENGETFIRITNKDIYNEIRGLKEHLTEKTDEIILHQKETNGKVKNNRTLIYVGGTGIFALAGWFITFLLST